MSTRKWADKFCAICERKLTEKDSEHVCRLCFHAAREKKQPQFVISEQAANAMGLAYGFSSLLGWGIQKLVEYSQRPKVVVDDKTFDFPLV